MKKARLTLDELTETLRQQSVVSIDEVQFAILETNGQLSVIKKTSESPPAAKILGVTAEETKLPVIIINDGRLMSDNLKSIGYETDWLTGQLVCHGYDSIRDIYLMTADDNGNVHIEVREGKR